TLRQGFQIVTGAPVIPAAPRTAGRAFAVAVPWPIGARVDDLFQLKGPISGRRIVVAMSGGVDSSVVAALAARTGAETIGVTLQLYDHGAAVGRAGSCCAGRDIRDARAVCARLRISPFVFALERRVFAGAL